MAGESFAERTVREVILKRTEKALKKATTFLANKVKERLSVAAPRGSFKDKKGNTMYLALEHARPDAFPRKVSGVTRQSVWHKVEVSGGKATGYIGTNLKHARPLEEGYTARAGTWFPMPASAALARYHAKFQTGAKGKTLKLKPNEFRWIKRKKSKWIPPHPVWYKTVNDFRKDIVDMVSKIVNEG